jgi:ribosomal protein S21
LIILAIEVRKKDKESTGSLLRRFSRRVQQSGVLLRARKGRFYQKSKTRRQMKASALRRQELRKQRTELIKLGLLEEGQMIPKDKIRFKKR